MEDLEQRKAVLALIRRAMPGVARIVAERRAAMGEAHVTECQRRGMAGEPGWFFAREGALAIGTPWAEVVDLVTWTASPSQAVVCLRSVGNAKEAADGA